MMMMTLAAEASLGPLIRPSDAEDGVEESAEGAALAAGQVSIVSQ